MAVTCLSVNVVVLYVLFVYVLALYHNNEIEVMDDLFSRGENRGKSLAWCDRKVFLLYVHGKVE